jgi:tetratricopeptide (TPR) repeat protein
MINRKIAALALVATAAACAPHIRPLEQTIDNGDVLRPEGDAVVERARVEGELQRERLADQRAASMETALATCTPEICAAISRGELSLGMTEAEVLAATRTTPHAWDTRGSGGVMMMTSRLDGKAPSDAVAHIAFIRFSDGEVASYTYHEPQGFRTVTTPYDATFAGRAAARANALLEEGDGYAAAGRLDLALERYDQADVLRPNHPETTLRIATTLDKTLRPIEAILQYQLFIHQLRLETIEAKGEAGAKIAEAIARAHERIIILEQR